MNKSSLYKIEDYVLKYDEDRYGGPFGEYLENLEVETFSSMINPESKTILDLGAGTGKLSIPLIMQSKKVLSADSSEHMLKIARVKSHQLSVDLKAVISDAHCLCFKDGAFDCVVSSRLLMHLADWKLAIKEISRVSKREFVIDFPSKFSFASLDILFRRIKRIIYPKTDIYKNFSYKEVIDEIEKNGFRVTESRKGFFIPITFHRWFNHPEISNKIETIFRSFNITEVFGSPITIKSIRKDSI